MEQVRVGSQRFFWLPRTPGFSLAYDPIYKGMRVSVVRKAVEREAGGPLQKEFSGFVVKPDNGDMYQPCPPFADGKRPAWIWYTI